MDDPARYRIESRQGWGAVAAAWGRHLPRMMREEMPMVSRLLDLARLQPGAAVLELAAGQGELGFMAHELIQPGGTLITSDFSPDMLKEAQQRAEALGLEGIRFKQIDAESIDVETASQDAVLCRWGYMLMADPGAALRETRRVLRPGGRVALAAWTGAEENRWSSVVSEVLVERGHVQPYPPGLPGQFAWGRPGIIQEHLEAAGFVEEIEVEVVDFTFDETFGEWWARTLEMSRVGTTINGLADDEQSAVREVLQERLAGFEREDGVLSMPARTWVAGASA